MNCTFHKNGTFFTVSPCVSVSLSHWIELKANFQVKWNLCLKEKSIECDNNRNECFNNWIEYFSFIFDDCVYYMRYKCYQLLAKYCSNLFINCLSFDIRALRKYISHLNCVFELSFDVNPYENVCLSVSIWV